MRRWQGRVARGTLLALALFFALLGIEPGLRHAVQRAAEQITGTHVRFARCNSCLRTGEIQLDAVRSLHLDRHELTHYHADRMTLQLDRVAALFGRIVVPRAVVDGLTLDLSRTLSAMERRPTATGELTTASQALGEKSVWWLMQLAECLEQNPGSEFRSEKLAKSWLVAWPQLWQEAEQRALDVQSKITRVKGELRSAGENPLRNIDPYQRAIPLLESLDREIVDARRQIEQASQQMLMDQDSLAKARQEDLRLATALGNSATIDGELLSQFLLKQEVRCRVTSILDWIRCGQSYLPALQQEALSTPRRGELIAFPSCRQTPDIEIETLVLRGVAKAPGFLANIEGTLSHLSSHPRRSEEPMELVVQTTGDFQGAIHVRQDYAGAKRRRQIRVQCPHWNEPERQFGHPKYLGIIATGSPGLFQYEIEMLGDELDGTLQYQQTGTALSPRIGGGLATREFSAILSRAVEQVSGMTVKVRIRGSLDFPKWEVESNLGPQLVQAIQSTVEHELSLRRKAELERRHAQFVPELKAIADRINDRGAELQGQLQKGLVEVEGLRRVVASRVNQHDAMIEPNSPLRESYRR